jgi:phosphoribosylglycinamide formyltransferase-1
VISNQEKKTDIVILISGGGSNLQSFIDACNRGVLDGRIAAVISNKANVKGLERAKIANIPSFIVDHNTFPTRDAFDLELATVVNMFKPDLVILAGFMRILTASFVNQYVGRMINIHPSVLPAYPGLNTHQRAIDAKDTIAGATVHFVTPELDGGPPVLQATVPIEKQDTAELLGARVLNVEHKIYPIVAQWFCQGRLTLRHNKVFHDGVEIDEKGLLFKDK